MQFAKRFVPWSLACMLSLAVGCAQQTSKGVTTQKKNTPAATKGVARLTAAPKVPQTAGQTGTPDQANQQIINRAQLAERIRKMATERAQQSAAQTSKNVTPSPTQAKTQHAAKATRTTSPAPTKATDGQTPPQPQQPVPATPGPQGSTGSPTRK